MDNETHETEETIEGTSEGAGALEEAQRLTHYQVEGRRYPRLPYGTETFRTPVEADARLCRHCDASKGQLHEPLCDYEQCPVCHGQVMSCDCDIFTEDAIGPK